MAVFFDPQLEKKPDFVQCMERIYAWYEHHVIDRVPVRFSAHNAEFDTAETSDRWPSLKDRWYDTDYQIEKVLQTVEKGSFLGETFPMYFPNLGPNVFAGMMGAQLEFGDVTSWAKPCLSGAEELDKLAFNALSEYLLKLNELTDCALQVCAGKFLVGYTDMHPGLDCADALLGTQELFYQITDDPDFVKEVIQRCADPFLSVMKQFHAKLFAHGQLSVTWMQIPSYEGMHIPSCDLGSMISQDMFEEFALPYIQQEVKHFRHNIFHVDGKGVARHLDALLAIPEIQAYQWVQGVGEDRPIMQWVPLIEHIQAANKSVVVDLHLDELEPFMEAVRPEGILLCIDESDPEVQARVLDKLLKWK